MIDILELAREQNTLVSYALNDVFYDKDGVELNIDVSIIDDAVAEYTHKENFTRAISSYIQEGVDKLNADTGFAFNDMHSFGIYINNTASVYYPHAVNIINWNDSVWTTARNIQAEVLAGTRAMPTVDELLLELPAFVGV